MQEKTDKELYKEFLLGNNESFEEIVKRHKNSIIYFIQRYTKSIDIAEDLAQDVFLYVLIHKKNYRFEYSLKTYLYTIAKSKALNYIKREKRIVAIDEKEYENIKDVEELEEKVFKNERAENLKNAIQKLKLEYQNVIGKQALHPTQKPVLLLEYLIKTYTNENETVLDNCMGSGSTGVACINTNRKFIGMEMDNKYYEIACKRIEDAKACSENIGTSETD